MADEVPPTRTILRAGFVGRGRMECDGKDHWFVREDHAKHNCAPETHMGPCMCPKPPAAGLEVRQS